LNTYNNLKSMQGYAAAQAHSGRAATGSWPGTARGQFQAALLSATVRPGFKLGRTCQWIQVGPHVPDNLNLKARGRASQSQLPAMTGRTGSESWGRSDVGEAVDINLVMHSVPGPGGRHYHVDRAAGPLARGYDALSARVIPTPPVGPGQTDSYYACKARRIQVHPTMPAAGHSVRCGPGCRRSKTFFEFQVVARVSPSPCSFRILNRIAFLQ
jgi:hypothetical protein